MLRRDFSGNQFGVASEQKGRFKIAGTREAMTDNLSTSYYSANYTKSEIRNL